MSKDIKFPTSQQLNRWEKQMKETGLWLKKIKVTVSKNPKIKPRKLGAAANAASVKPVTQDQGRQVEDMLAGHKRHWTRIK